MSTPELDDGRCTLTEDGSGAVDVEDGEASPSNLKRKEFERELARLQLELVKLQHWVKQAGLRVVLLFEGRDAAGKGGVIKRIIEPLNPRGASIVALGTPGEREKTQWYFQRYLAHLPGAGEIVMFDRSWYNRAGVERVMGFCSDEEYWEFMHSCPELERMLVRDGIVLRRYTVEADDKRRARLNCISHVFDTIDYEDVLPDPIELPPRPKREDYRRPPREAHTEIIEKY